MTDQENGTSLGRESMQSRRRVTSAQLRVLPRLMAPPTAQKPAKATVDYPGLQLEREWRGQLLGDICFVTDPVRREGPTSHQEPSGRDGAQQI